MKIEEILTETILDETSMNRVMQHAKTRNIGLISASRQDEEITAEINNKNTEQLISDLGASGFGYIPITGSYVENLGKETERKVIEKSFLVIGSDADDSGNLLGFLKREGKKFNQESVLYKPYDSEDASLISPITGEVLTVLGKFHVGKLGDYSSKIKSKNKEFTFTNVKLGESKLGYSNPINRMANFKTIIGTEIFSVKKLTKITD
jgi:hypothetical protein